MEIHITGSLLHQACKLVSLVTPGHLQVRVLRQPAPPRLVTWSAFLPANTYVMTDIDMTDQERNIYRVTQRYIIATCARDTLP